MPYRAHAPARRDFTITKYVRLLHRFRETGGLFEADRNNGLHVVSGFALRAVARYPSSYSTAL